MFYGCKALTSAPYLSASTLVDWCYNSMFFNCKSLTSISADFTDWNTSGNSTKNWVTGIETIGNFYNDNVDFIHSDDNVPEKWKPDYSTTPLTFVGKAANNAVCLSSIGSPHTVTLQYSKNKGAWTDYTINDVIELSANEIVSFSGIQSPRHENASFFSKDSSNYYQFIMTGTIESLGNVQSLVNFVNKCHNYCYFHLFYNCTSLITAPSLLATTLVADCYNTMFDGCTSLTDAPHLPATTLANKCYFDMFGGCSNLSSIDVDFTAWNGIATYYWVDGVAANGIFYKPSELS